MPTALATRPTHVTDRAGCALFISRKAAVSWLTTVDRALQCSGCGEIHDTADAAFDCCGTHSAYPVVAWSHDPQLVRNITATELAERL